MCQLKGKKNLHFRSSPCVGVVWVEVADDIMYVLFCAGACFLLVGLAAGTLGGGGGWRGRRTKGGEEREREWMVGTTKPLVAGGWRVRTRWMPAAGGGSGTGREQERGRAPHRRPRRAQVTTH